MSEISSQLRQLRKAAASDDWHEREGAGFALRDLLEERFDEVIEKLPDWVADPNERVRRAACLACMQRKRKSSPARVNRVLSQLRRLMKDESLYVRKACGPFVVGYLGYTYPEQTLPWLRKEAGSRNLERRINVAKAFSQAFGRRFPADAVELLEMLDHDPPHRLRSAIGSSVRNVAKTDQGRKLLDRSDLARFLSDSK